MVIFFSSQTFCDMITQIFWCHSVNSNYLIIQIVRLWFWYKCKMYKLYLSIATHEYAFSKCNIPCANRIEAQISNIWSIELFGLNRKNPSNNQSIPPAIDIVHHIWMTCFIFDWILSLCQNLCHTFFYFICCLISVSVSIICELEKIVIINWIGFNIDDNRNWNSMNWNLASIRKLKNSIFGIVNATCVPF